MAAYLTLTEFKLQSTIPVEVLEAIEVVTPGWIDAQLSSASSHIDARLAKRYEVPFSSPYPAQIQDWVAAIVSAKCYERRGVDPVDRQVDRTFAAADLAETEIKEAQDFVGDSGGTAGMRGAFELPLRADTSASGISKGGPRIYSEQSPYVWHSRQATTGREEDSSGSGRCG